MTTARFDGKVAVVTGAASGIGSAIATALIAEGAQVVGLDIDEPGLQKKSAELGDSFVPVVADVTVESQVESGIATAATRFSRLDIAFNVAGGSRIGAITDLAEADWDFTVDLVQKSVFLCTKHESRLMRDTGGGAIVNISSLDGRIPMPVGSPYATGKAGVVMFTKNAALELAQHRIRVNAVLPGLVDTPLVAAIMGYEPAKQMFLDRIPLGAAATPEQIAAPCLFLASEDASYITGIDMVIDGGWELSNFPNLAKLAG
ncbi:SDR family NAD(P)-dependent oxidoreductase [Nocardia crassostreae]|uniref:SDR family NAD(P)-dependent oxidoreductase n=1 Tax=Nocardia crassostreae TaxID=53428 RepID=UPI000836FCE7|nr:SDR family NAD(P)-dependent oxidoreductase [Nocardia crassostreae]